MAQNGASLIQLYYVTKSGDRQFVFEGRVCPLRGRFVVKMTSRAPELTEPELIEKRERTGSAERPGRRDGG